MERKPWKQTDKMRPRAVMEPARWLAFRPSRRGRAFFNQVKTYAEKLKDPRWQRKRLEIMDRDRFTCTECGDAAKTLHVHHTNYEAGKQPWEHDAANMTTLCESCHDEKHGKTSQSPDADKNWMRSIDRILFHGASMSTFNQCIGLVVDCHKIRGSCQFINRLFERIAQEFGTDVTAVALEFAEALKAKQPMKFIR
jgi:5-methylcytosine-specific restriction endonuclease McrA